MSKTVYRRKTLEPELGYVATQNFMMQQAKRGIESPLRTSRVVRVWSGEGKARCLKKSSWRSDETKSIKQTILR